MKMVIETKVEKTKGICSEKNSLVVAGKRRGTETNKYKDKKNDSKDNTGKHTRAEIGTNE